MSTVYYYGHKNVDKNVLSFESALFDSTNEITKLVYYQSPLSWNLNLELLKIYVEWSKGRSGGRDGGHFQFFLFSIICPCLRSHARRRRVMEGSAIGISLICFSSIFSLSHRHKQTHDWGSFVKFPMFCPTTHTCSQVPLFCSVSQGPVGPWKLLMWTWRNFIFDKRYVNFGQKQLIADPLRPKKACCHAILWPVGETSCVYNLRHKEV